MAQPVIEGGIGTKSWSTEEGAKLTEQSKPAINVRQPLLSEILTKVHRAKTKDDKVRILKEENCRALQQICQWSFNPSIKSMIPEGIPPFVENDAPEGTEHMLLRSEGDKLWHFVSTDGKPANPNLQSTKRENMFIRLLEGLHKDEAKLLCIVKEKKLHREKEGGYKGLSSEVVKEAFNWDQNFKVKGV